MCGDWSEMGCGGMGDGRWGLRWGGGVWGDGVIDEKGN